MSIGSLKGGKWALLAFATLAMALLLSFGRPADTVLAGPGNTMVIDAVEDGSPASDTIEASATAGIGLDFMTSVDITDATTPYWGMDLVILMDSNLDFVPTFDNTGNMVLESWTYVNGMTSGMMTTGTVTQVGQKLQGGCSRPTATTTNFTGEVVHATFSCNAADDADGAGAGTGDDGLLHLVAVGEATIYTSTLAVGGGVITTALADADIDCEEQADWFAVKGDDPDPVLAGGTLTYTLTAENLGPNASRGMTMWDELPNPLTGTSAVAKELLGIVPVDIGGDIYYSIPGAVDVDQDGDGDLTDAGDIDGGTCLPGYIGTFPNPQPPPAVFSNFVVCSIEGAAVQPFGMALVNSLPPDAIVTVTLDVFVPLEDAGKPNVNIGGTFMSDSASPPFLGDPNPTVDPKADNEEPDCTILGFVDPANMACEMTVAAPGNVTIDKKVDLSAGFVDGGDSVAGATVRYRIDLENEGPSPVTGVVVTDDIDGAVLSYAGNLTTSAGVLCTEPVDPVNDPLVCTVGTSDADSDGTVDDMDVNDTAWIEYDATYDPTLANVTVTNTAGVTWIDSQPLNEDSVSVFVRPAAATMVKDPAMSNIWLCVDWSSDGVDNDGDTTVDNEAATCLNEGEGSLTITEIARNVADIDSPNDDDDCDGYPVSEDYCLEFGCPPEMLALVDHEGDEVPEGLGAYEFQLKFEHKLVDLTIENGPFLGSTGRTVLCDMTILTENDIRFACASIDPSGPPQCGNPYADDVGPSGMGPPAGWHLATINVLPEPDLYIRLRPAKDNGVVTTLLDENCQWADTLGDPMSGTLPGGLLEFCEDSKLTIRYLEGDLNADCKVDLLDEQSIAFRYGTFFGSLWYDDWYDLEPPLLDYDIDIKDLQFVFGRDGSTCADPYPPQNPVDP